MQRGKSSPQSSPAVKLPSAKTSLSSPSSAQPSIQQVVHTESMIQEEVSPTAQPSTSMGSNRKTNLIKLVEAKKHRFVEMSITSVKNCKTALVAASNVACHVEDYNRRKRLGKEFADPVSNIYYHRMFDTTGYIFEMFEMKSDANSYSGSDNVHVARMFFIVFQTMAIIFHIFEQHFQSMLESGMPMEFEDFLDSISHIWRLYKGFTATKSNIVEFRLEVLVKLCYELKYDIRSKEQGAVSGGVLKKSTTQPNVPPAGTTSEVMSSSTGAIPKQPRVKAAKKKKPVPLALTQLSELEKPLEVHLSDLHLNSDDDFLDEEFADGTSIEVKKLWTFAKCFFNLYSNCPQEMSKDDGVDIINHFLYIVGIPDQGPKDEIGTSLIFSFVLHMDITKMNFATFMDNLMYNCDELTTVMQRLEAETLIEGAVPSLRVKERDNVKQEGEGVKVAPKEVDLQSVQLETESDPVTELKSSHSDVDHDYEKTEKVEASKNIPFANIAPAEQSRILKLLASDILLRMLENKSTTEDTTQMGNDCQEQLELAAFLNANKDLIKEIVAAFAQELDAEDMLQKIYEGEFN